MTILTVTAKGQVTLRKEVLQHLGVKPGDKIAVDVLPDGKASLSAVRPKDALKGFIGSLHQPGERARSLEEINQAIRDGWAGKR
ncbi:AbrB/MazE/SpoVT family DNA-binding domain-containing protein [Aminobacter anthyllidis]|uniref:AbrB/MazE/SpoVT family DNA-binding domain-containing protein n=1 Tax=Aminobacter anthyllidis TaxID=1035067 RepID=A0A9X1A9B1_9HYPH|nr:AbrB/MazE/SpoVT family DNA-binding domain-containing protein [Aminobacter anthyllidis]MBT1155663.1 AbrB/MazE/SpoVT family DNA-binding domain-containing protein [Aminobacter anthyllidis]MDH4986085.1 AbrB/MazE/SpoVT family DNA-binding domain-containing protein [Aminobacter anthyllidis]